MTVCIAALFTWWYTADESGIAALTMSDRMITAGDIEYEPPQFKTCFLTNSVHILVAGDVPTHSEAISAVQRQIAVSQENNVGIIASLYADALADIKSREAARAILRPAGLNQETFISRQNELSPGQVALLTQQMQEWRGPQTDALIVGADDIQAHIWRVDSTGSLSCENDVGFAAIGIGAWHAKSQFMLAGWGRHIHYAGALGIAYLAKKSAEVAPGVGSFTDMFIITRRGWETVVPPLQERLSVIHREYEEERRKLATSAISRITSAIHELAKLGKGPDGPVSEQSGSLSPSQSDDATSSEEVPD